jgi:tetratricopeptide (TPR) repeat protein
MLFKVQSKRSAISTNDVTDRQRIQFFNAALSLPIQMVCVMLQLEQRGLTTESHASLDQKLVSLEKSMTNLAQSLNSPSRRTTLIGSDAAPVEDEGMKTYVAFAKKFLATASAAASVRSSLSTVSPAVEPDRDTESQSAAVISKSIDDQARVEGWIQVSSPTSQEPRQPPQMGLRHSHLKLKDGADDSDLEIEFMRTKQHLKLGQEGNEAHEYAKAERHFRRALALMQRHDFDGRISLQPAEVILLLADCCLHQEKLDEAIALLLPIAERRSEIFPPGSTPETTTRGSGCAPDTLQALAADHLLGRVFMLRGDFDNAECHGLRAFTERRKELGRNDEKTIESVQLVIEIYRTRGEDGDEEEAEVYEVFLSPTEDAVSVPALKPQEMQHSDQQALISSVDSPGATVLQSPQSAPRGIRDRLRHLGRHSQSGMPPSPDLQRFSISRSTTLNDAIEPEHLSPFGLQGIRSPSIASTQDQTLSVYDDSSVATPPSTTLERSSSSRILEPTYKAITDLCREGKENRAIKIALPYLGTYQSKVMIIREPELRENLRHGIGRGLAKTGKGYAPLHFFCELNVECTEEINLLIRDGVDVNAVAYKAGYTKDPFTALQLATERGFSNITALLLAVRGIKTNVRDPEGYTPLMTACRKGYHTIVTQLLSFPLPTDFPQTWHGNTLLHDASRRCDPVLVELFLDHHAEIDHRDRFGKTALMHAVVKADIPDPVERRKRIRGRCMTVRILLESGADPTLKDYRTGKSVREYAVEEEDQELMMLIDQAPRNAISELVA